MGKSSIVALPAVTLVLLFGGLSGQAAGHSSGCHSAHTCPSDHHTYVWYDSSGQGWSCAEPGAPEYDSSRDTTVITYGGYTYYCYAVGPPPPPPQPPPAPPDSDGDGVPDARDTCPYQPGSTSNGCPPPASPLSCGSERWPVKTLSDPAAGGVHYTPRRATIDALRRLRAPQVGDDTPRIAGVETTTYTVRATLLGAKREADRDLHLVIADPRHRRHTMIVEFPDVRCRGAASSNKKAKMRSARSAFTAACGSPARRFKRLRGTATVTGVGFFDERHGQTGVAPNGIELHPVLGFRLRSVRC